MMGDARMLVFPARWYEGQPRTIVEALAKGTPVIAPRHGPMPDLVDDRKTGLLFEPGNAADLADKAISLFSDQFDQRPMRQACRRDFESRFTAQQNHSLLIACYENAMYCMRSHKEPAA